MPERSVPLELLKKHPERYRALEVKTGGSRGFRGTACFLKPPLYDAKPDFWKRRCAQLLTNGMETSRVILKFIM